MRLPAANLFRFSPDYAQHEAGLGTYAYRELGWRRATVVADDANPGMGGSCGLHSGVLRAGWQSRRDRLLSHPGPGSDAALAHACPTASPRYSTYIDPGEDPRPACLATRRSCAACWSGARTSRTRSSCRQLGRKLDGVVGSDVASCDAPSRCPQRLPQALARCIPRATRVLREPFVSDRLLQRRSRQRSAALETHRSADVRAGLLTELRRPRPRPARRHRRPRPEPAGGSRRLSLADRRPARQARRSSRSGSCRTSSRPSAGLLSAAPPPGPDSSAVSKGGRRLPGRARTTVSRRPSR